MQLALTQNRMANMYLSQHKYDKAIPLLVTSVHIFKRLLGPRSDKVAQALRELATSYSEVNEYSKAELTFAEALQAAQGAFGSNHPEVASTLERLFKCTVEKQHNYSKSEQIINHLLEVQISLYGEYHADVARTLNNLSAVCEKQGQMQNLCKHSKRRFGIIKKLLGDKHQDLVAECIRLATILLYAGKEPYESVAKPLFEEALMIQRTLYGQYDAKVAATLQEIAQRHFGERRFDLALEATKRALVIQQKSLSDHDHPDVVTTLNNLAAIYEALDDTHQFNLISEELYLIKERRYTMANSQLMPMHVGTVGKACFALASAFEEEKDRDKAIAYYQKCIKVFMSGHLGDHPSNITAILNLTNMFVDGDEWDLAACTYANFVEIAEEEFGPEYSGLLEGFTRMGEYLFKQGKNTEAEKFLMRAVTVGSKLLVASSEDDTDRDEKIEETLRAMTMLTIIYSPQSKWTEAKDFGEEAFELAKASSGEISQDVAARSYDLAVIHYNLRKLAKASDYAQRALRILEVQGDEKDAGLFDDVLALIKALKPQ